MYLCALKKKKKTDMTLSILQPFQANCIHVLHCTYTGIWISSNNHKNVRKFTVSIDD